MCLYAGFAICCEALNFWHLQIEKYTPQLNFIIGLPIAAPTADSRKGFHYGLHCLKITQKWETPRAPEALGGWGTDLPSPAQAAAIEKLFSFIRSEPVYGSVLPEVELPTAATDMTTANTKMIPNACNTILLSSLTVS